LFLIHWPLPTRQDGDLADAGGVPASTRTSPTWC